MLEPMHFGAARMTHALHVLSLLTALAVASGLDSADIAGRPDAESWRTYLERSERLAAADRNALLAELAAAGGVPALQAPDGDDFRPPDPTKRAWYASQEAGRLVDAVLSFQTPSGGWSKHVDYSRGPRRPCMQWTSQSEPGRPPHYQATFDNASTVRQIEFLAMAWHGMNRDACALAVNRGLRFILDAQYPNGGWPQVYPLEGGYHDAITYNDNSMTNILKLLKAIGDGDERYDCVDETLRPRLAESLERGIECVLSTQVIIDGHKTVWCGQHHPLTQKPVAARIYEPPSLSGVESGQMLRFLMSLEEPSPEVVVAVEAGLDWLESATVTGIRRVKADGRTIYKRDASSDEMYWARFYDLETGRPIFPGKDGVVYDSFESMAAANDKLGYDYYSTQPGGVLTSARSKWRKRRGDGL
jgi:PelA/Pel-15E family pectate lyase